MKSLVSFLGGCALVFMVSCHSGNTIPSDVVNNPNTAVGKADLSVLPAFEFQQDVHDFGKLIEGESVSYTFIFRNSGKSDLLISDVSTSCGCTVPSYPKTPIKPGKYGSIRVTFNSAGKHGFQNKNIIVVANTQPNTKLLMIKAQVVAAGRE
ncbi:MAG TPA: DUF1573 domain-containing protein [Bacteroidales bacterium]|nr:DUF1573 domain-containing protein [Bacteroidales bacterium]